MSMNPEPHPRKAGRRPYDARARRARARAARTATLDEAERLFLDRGYDGTTVEAIARAAGVSAATIYKSHGGKAGLVRELCRRALAGERATPAEDRSDALVRDSADPADVVRGWGALAAEVSPRVSPLALLLQRAAGGEQEAARLLAELEDARLRRMTDNARRLVSRGHVRRGVTVEEARDVMWMCTSPELYDLMVVRRGWSTDRFGTLIADTLAGALL